MSLLRSRVFIGCLGQTLVVREDIIELCRPFGPLMAATLFKVGAKHGFTWSSANQDSFFNLVSNTSLSDVFGRMSFLRLSVRRQIDRFMELNHAWNSVKIHSQLKCHWCSIQFHPTVIITFCTCFCKEDQWHCNCKWTAWSTTDLSKVISLPIAAGLRVRAVRAGGGRGQRVRGAEWKEMEGRQHRWLTDSFIILYFFLENSIDFRIIFWT